MKKVKEFGCVVVAAVLYVVGVAGAVVISEPFDVYPGGGTNWSGEWGVQGTVSHTISLSSVSPFKGDSGSYLNYRTTATGLNGVGRDFAGSLGSGTYTLTLNVRIDDIGTFFAGNSLSNDRIQIRGETGSGSTDHGASGAWLIMATPGTDHDNWYVYDGTNSPGNFVKANFEDSGIAVVEGKVYSFTVTVHPETLTYDATISDGTTVYTNTDATFRTTSTAPADRLVFSNRTRTIPSGSLPDSTPIEVSYDSIHIFAPGAHDPQPANGQIQVPVADLVLSWSSLLSSNPDPNTSTLVINPALTGHYLYLSKANDPNLPSVTPVFITADADQNGQIDATASYTLPSDLEMDGVYYWRVDESLGASGPNDDPNLFKGTVWSFTSATASPLVYAGQNVVSYLEAGTATVQLAAAVEWFNPQNAILWSVDSQPAGTIVQFSNAAIEDPIVTMDTAGTYVLSLEAQDTKGATGEDTMEIHVYADSCQAAQNILGYQSNIADLNRDCRVNLDDFSLVAANWLEQDFLLENYLY